MLDSDDVTVDVFLHDEIVAYFLGSGDLAGVIEPDDQSLASFVERDVNAGTWKWDEGVLVCEGMEAILEIPFRPPEEYDMICEFSIDDESEAAVYRDKYAMSIVLWESGQRFKVSMRKFLSGVAYGFEIADGKTVSQSDQTLRDRPRLESGRRYKCKMVVRKGRVKTYLDGAPLLDITTKGHVMTLWPSWADSRYPDSLMIGGGFSQNRFYVLTITPVTGVGHSLPIAATSQYPH